MPIAMENGVNVRFKIEYNRSPDLALGDRFTFTVTKLTRVTSLAALATLQYRVNESKGTVEFYSGDHHKVVSISYYGLGSFVVVDEINEVIDWFSKGAVVWRDIDTSMFAWGEWVGFDPQKAAPRPLERARSQPPIVRAIGRVAKVHKTSGEVTLRGSVFELDSIWDGGPGDDVWLGFDSPGWDGTPPQEPGYYGYLRQQLGRMLGVHEMLVHIGVGSVNGEQFVEPVGIPSDESFGTPTVTVG
jgi:hypothetical protein